MSDPALLWNAPRPPKREPVPGELLFALRRERDGAACTASSVLTASSASRRSSSTMASSRTIVGSTQRGSSSRRTSDGRLSSRIGP